MRLFSRNNLFYIFTFRGKTMRYSKWTGKIIVLGVLLIIIWMLLSSKMEAAENSEISLTGPWRMLRDDNSAFKNPDYDDSFWQSVQVPSNVKEKLSNEEEVVWYRTWVFIPADLSQYNLGLRLGSLAAADETFINGYSLGKNEIDMPADLPKIRIYPIPDKYLKPASYNLVAIRLKPASNSMEEIYSERPRIEEYNALFLELVRTEVVNIVFSGIFIVIGGSFIAFFLKRRKDWELLYFGLGALTMGIYTFISSQWRFYIVILEDYIPHLYFAVIATMIPAFARFSYLHLEGQRGLKSAAQRIFDYASRGMVYVSIMVNLGLIFYPNYDFWEFFTHRINLYLSLIFSIIAIVHALTKFSTGSFENRVVITFFILAFMSGIVETLWIPLNLHVNFVMWGVMTLVLICTVVLINQFFYLQDKVKEYSVGLEKLVDVRTEQLKLMEESRRRLLANISHDLRTPVSSVLGHAELLLEDVVDSPDEQRTYIKRIHSKMLGFNRLIQDLFELAKIESQQERFQMVPLSAAEFMEDIYQKYVFDVENLGIQFENTSNIAKDIMVVADAQRLEQVFANLISNATRYVNQGGTIRIACQQTEKEFCGYTIDGYKQLVCFTVADNGIGVAPEFVPHIFERFNRGGESGTSPAEHSGLGLAISKEIVVAHGGRIWVDTEVSQGCTIHFILPALVGEN